MYYMWYYTGEHKYREWANAVLQALNAVARTTYGFSAIDAVDAEEHTMRDTCESFFYAETLKSEYGGVLAQTGFLLKDTRPLAININAFPRTS